MATAFDDQHDAPALAGRCNWNGISLPVAVTGLTSDGCILESADGWTGPEDFVHLEIVGIIATNGKLTGVEGHRAQMRFYGQVHPAAIAKLLEQAASR